MDHRQTDLLFIKRFRQQPVIYHSMHARRFGNVIIRQFAGREDELRSISKFCSQKLEHPAILNNLVVKLKEEDCEDTLTLSSYIQDMLIRLASYACNEPVSQSYIDRLSGTLTSFLALVDNYYENVQHKLLERLNVLLLEDQDEEEEGYVPSETIDDVRLIISKYGNIAYGHCQHLETLLQRTMGKECPAYVIDGIEQMLMTLVDLAERSIINAESTTERLETWREQVAGTEMQEMFN